MPSTEKKFPWAERKTPQQLAEFLRNMAAWHGQSDTVRANLKECADRLEDLAALLDKQAY